MASWDGARLVPPLHARIVGLKLERASLKETCRAQALELGIDVCGFSTIAPELRRDYYAQWIADGKHGTMGWMERNNDRRLNPESAWPEAKTIVSLGLNYFQKEPQARGRISKYALGKDYHKLFYKKLKRLCTWMREQGGNQRPYVDTGPILEKPIAVSAGLGWQAKNTLLLNKKFGPYLFLGTIITDLEFEPDPEVKDHCGRCTKCIDVCPTQAITAPYQLDARKCIAYLTIEHEGTIPLEFRKAIGNRIFGCDECLDICPWVYWAKETREANFKARPLPDLREMLFWDEATFDQTFAGTPIRRSKLHRWKRNICVALGNIGDADDLEALRNISESENSVIAEHAAWAIAEIKKRDS
ncbi:MAG: tRNA epoxyqueuosine(34) reductase QueG [Verrucomicrobiota bacterium]